MKSILYVKPETLNSSLPALMAGLVGLVYLLAALSKLMDPVGFYHSVQAYRLLPDLPAWWLAHYLPCLELAAGLVLWLPGWRRTGAWFVVCLSMVFIFALGSLLIRGMDISCGCFGTGDGWWNSVPVALIKNGVLLTAAVWVLRKDRYLLAKHII